MKSTQKTLFVVAIVAALCALLVAGVTASASTPDVTIGKTVSPTVIEPTYTGVLTYTVTLTNNYTDTIANVEMWDVLHPMLSFGEWVTAEPDNFVDAGNIISWTTSISAETTITFTFTAELPLPQTMTLLVAEGKIDNTAYFSVVFGDEPDTILIAKQATATTRFYRYIFLPLVMRMFVN